MGKILLIGTLDTKGKEISFLRDQLEERGQSTLLLDVGIHQPVIEPDIDRHQVAQAAGMSIQSLITSDDRGEAVAIMTKGVKSVVHQLFKSGDLDGVISAGGSAGTTIACSAMQILPFGFPKVMISTLASGDVSGFVGIKDIVMVPAVVDINGLNRINRRVFSQAAGAICGMVNQSVTLSNNKKTVAATMFGNTTKCVDNCRLLLEAAGFEVLIFHATGIGGRTMENLVESGQIAGVLDVTTTELADEVVGGVMRAGPERLLAAARSGVPAVVVPGCLDMVNFWAPETIPKVFSDRLFYQHNPNVTLMRTNSKENRELGARFALNLNQSTGPVSVYIPTKGISVISAPGESFHDPKADASFRVALSQELRDDIQIHERPVNINDSSFSQEISQALISMMDQHSSAIEI